MDKKKDKVKYLTGKVPQPKTTQKKKHLNKREGFLSKKITKSFLTEIKKKTDLTTTLQCQKISDPQILKKFQLIQEP